MIAASQRAVAGAAAPAAASTVHYYVWYRVSGDLASAQRIVAALQDDVALHSAVRGRLLTRRDDPTTWMEIYEHVEAPAAFEHALGAATLRHDAGAIAHNAARHVEAFVAPD